MLRKNIQSILIVSVILVATLACNLSSPSASPQENPIQPIPSPGAAASETQAISSPVASALPAGATVAVTHLLTPADINPKGTLMYDVDSSGTASQHRAPYGDSYNINLFERPFTQKDMTYIPSLDINTFQIASDDTFYYVFITLIGDHPNDPANIDYGVEIDKDQDGYGDVLVWANPSYTTQWTTNDVKVYADSNHDTGGASPEKSDANATTAAPYPGNGYDRLVFNQGQGDDPDLAWVRIDPKNPNVIDFAFKQSLAGSSFMWGVWADAGLKDPSKFNYNDRFTPAQAGSPVAGNQNYPINAIYAVDNTCRAPYGFKPTGYEPMLCTGLAQAAPTSKPKSCPAGVGNCGGTACVSAGTLIDTPNGWIAVQDLKIGDAVWTEDTSGSRVASTLLYTLQTPVPAGHPIVHVVLQDGRELLATPPHPTIDGRKIGDLATGDYLDGTLIKKVEVVATGQTVLYDILPSGDTGYYWANGILVGSGLK